MLLVSLHLCTYKCIGLVLLNLYQLEPQSRLKACQSYDNLMCSLGQLYVLKYNTVLNTNGVILYTCSKVK